MGAEMTRPIHQIDAAFDAFGFLPHDDDPRWSFLERYAEISARVGFKAINFANAYGRAVYLSDVASYAVGFVTSYGDENELQLSRALDNLGHKYDVHDRFAASSDDFSDFDIRLALTDRLSTDPTKAPRAITPCPEALYQLRLFVDGEYLARSAFNVHHVDEAVIQSVVNIQGTPGSVARNAAFAAQHGISPFNLLVRRAVAMGQVVPGFRTRGLLNPKRGNSRLYWSALEGEHIEHWHAIHKPLQGRPVEPTEG